MFIPYSTNAPVATEQSPELVLSQLALVRRVLVVQTVVASPTRLAWNNLVGEVELYATGDRSLAFDGE